MTCVCAAPLAAQHEEREGAEHGDSGGGRFEAEGYGVINYYHFAWQTDPNRRDAVDLERFVLESNYKVSKRLQFAAEVEFEHGGTGVTMEFDRFEEFGEYEQEVEKGGEVKVEKLEATFLISPRFNIRVGHVYVPVGLVSQADEPDEYFTNTRNESEAAMIPTVWDETGVGFFGQIGRFHYQGLVVTGLDATGFSSANWVRLGHQGRFETVNADNFAVVGRLDFDVADETRVGVSAYHGNSADNRPKPDLQVPANVTIFDAHATAEVGVFRARALVLFGHLQNADQVSDANRNLSNNLNVKRTPVGSEALAWFVEAGANVLGAHSRMPLFLYGRYDWYDTMYKVTGDVFDNPRWARKAVTTGINWFPDPHFIVKASYSHRTIGLPSNNREDTVALGVAALF
ncbi:MAG TPA: hypothetical protein VLV16_08640 [Gemmatimonadales bacterium]|nr:hypothetical protein [Gemmatimonadales bacterium]